MRSSPAPYDLARMSARIGKDPLLVQGPGGNTSLKAGQCLWVKASGRWLAQADEREVFVPLRLAAVLERIEAGDAEDFGADVISAEAAGGLRPSIETAFHALMPHPVVVHAHAVNSMTISVLSDGEGRARERLDDAVSWCWIPYRRPGRRLAQCIREHIQDVTFDVLLLQNHGVVVGAATPDEAEHRLRQVEERLQLPVEPLPVADAARILAFETDAYRACTELSGVALNDSLLDRLTSAALVPDQAVFLGGPLAEQEPGESADETAERVRRGSGVTPTFIAVRGAGVLGRTARSRAAEPLLRALVEIARRLPDGAATNGLSPECVADLLDWDAERYRQTLNRAGFSDE